MGAQRVPNDIIHRKGFLYAAWNVHNLHTKYMMCGILYMDGLLQYIK